MNTVSTTSFMGQPERTSVTLECSSCSKMTTHQLGAVLGLYPLTTLRRIDCQECSSARLWWDDDYDHPGRIWGMAPYSPAPVQLDEAGLRELGAREFPGAAIVGVVVEDQQVWLRFPGGQDVVYWTVGEDTILCTARDVDAWAKYTTTPPVEAG